MAPSVVSPEQLACAKSIVLEAHYGIQGPETWPSYGFLLLSGCIPVLHHLADRFAIYPVTEMRAAFYRPPGNPVLVGSDTFGRYQSGIPTHRYGGPEVLNVQSTGAHLPHTSLAQVQDSYISGMYRMLSNPKTAMKFTD